MCITRVQEVLAADSSVLKVLKGGHCGCGPLGLSFTVTKAYISLLVVVLLLDTGCCVVKLCLEFPDPLGLIWENVKEHS